MAFRTERGSHSGDNASPALRLSMPLPQTRMSCVAIRDGRQELRDFPISLDWPEQEARQVVHVDALHGDDNCTRALVVETGQQRIREPLIDGGPSLIRESVVRLEGVVDDDEVSASTGKGAANGRRETEPAREKFDFGFVVFERPDAAVRKRSIGTNPIRSRHESRSRTVWQGRRNS